MDCTQICVFAHENADADIGVWAPVLAQMSQGCLTDSVTVPACVERKNDGFVHNFWALTVFFGDGKQKAAR